MAPFVPRFRAPFRPLQNWSAASIRTLGHGHATQAARFDAGLRFSSVRAPRDWIFTCEMNHRSGVVMERLGMRCDPSEGFHHPGLREHHSLTFSLAALREPTTSGDHRTPTGFVAEPAVSVTVEPTWFFVVCCLCWGLPFPSQGFAPVGRCVRPAPEQTGSNRSGDAPRSPRLWILPMLFTEGRQRRAAGHDGGRTRDICARRPA